MIILKTIITLLSLSVLGLVGIASANQVQRKQGDDGVIEFSNVKQNKQNNTAKTIIYRYSGEGDGTVFTDQKPSHTAEYDILKFDCYACNPSSSINWYNVKLNTKSFANTVNTISKQHQVDPALVRALIHAESAFNSKAQSHQGAQGLMQLMPATAAELGVSDSFNPQQNINGGVRYLVKLLKQFDDNIKLAIAAYNAGPNAVKKYKGIPPYKETQVYVERVGILHKRYKNASEGI